MLKELQDIGLSEKEARVYLAALELGKTTAEKLAKQAGVNRSTTYVQLESLMRRGLMSMLEDGKTYYAPESPEYLRRVFEREQAALAAKKTGLEHMLPDLMRMYEGAGERPIVRFYTGKEGVSQMRNQVWEHNKNKKVLTLYSYDTLASVFTLEEREKYSAQRAKYGIEARVLYNRVAGPFPDDFSHTERRHLPESVLEVTNDFSIFDDKVIISNLKGALFGVLIESAQIAKSMSSIFEFMWKSAGLTNNKPKK